MTLVSTFLKPDPQIMSPCVLRLGLIALKAYPMTLWTFVLGFNRGRPTGSADDWAKFDHRSALFVLFMLVDWVPYGLSDGVLPLQPM